MENKTRQAEVEKAIEAWADTVNQLARPRFKRKKTQESRKEWLRRTLNGHNKDVRALWETFNEERSQLKPGLLSTDSSRFAYLLGFHLFNYERSNQMLTRLEDRYQFWSRLEDRISSNKKTKTHIIDLGCGSGALSQSLCTFVKTPITQISLVDSAKKIVDAAKITLEGTTPKTKVAAVKIPVEDYKTRSPEADIQIFSLGYIWNELLKNKKAQSNIMQLWQKGLANESKTMIHIVDSAHEHLSRSLMELRDTLSEMGYIALYPCPQNTSCPMLSRPKDWCFSNYHCELPKDYVTTYDKIIGTQHSVLSSSSYFFVSLAMYNYLELDKDKSTYQKQKIMVGNPVNKENQRINLMCSDSDKLEKRPANPNVHMLRGEVMR